MARILGLLGVLVALCLPRAVEAQEGFADQSELLTITGQVAADQKAAAQVGYTAVSIGFIKAPEDKVVWVGVVKAESWNDDVFEGRDMLARVEGYTPTMVAAAKQPLLSKIEQAPVGSRISIEGVFDQGARTYLVGMVKVTPPGGSK